MNSFIEEQINLGEKNISVASDYENLNALAEEGLIEKREDAGGIYYYVEAEADDMRLAFSSRCEKEGLSGHYYAGWTAL
jgi:Fe2+ or Zn2+ uptake regulation protein